jgi:SAM-dependent methyltransferase
VTGSPSNDWDQWRRQLSPTDYDERWRRIEAAGGNPHGEADLVFSYGVRSVLDAGCGTGRVAIELARRGLDVVGTDLDRDMIAVARAKAPELTWVQADLSELDLPTWFDAVVLAGNVIPYVARDRRRPAVIACARHLAPGGLLIAGFQLQKNWPNVEDYDNWCHSAGLTLEARYATWDRDPFTGADSYAVSVHRHGRGVRSDPQRPGRRQVQRRWWRSPPVQRTRERLDLRQPDG